MLQEPTSAELVNAVRYISSQKGHKVHCCGGYTYHRSKIGKEIEYWECSRRKISGCKSKMHVKLNSNPPEIIKDIGDHNHCMAFGNIEAKECVNR